MSKIENFLRKFEVGVLRSTIKQITHLNSCRLLLNMVVILFDPRLRVTCYMCQKVKTKGEQWIKLYLTNNREEKLEITTINCNFLVTRYFPSLDRFIPVSLSSMITIFGLPKFICALEYFSLCWHFKNGKNGQNCDSVSENQNFWIK